VFMDRQFHDPISSPFAGIDEWLEQKESKKYAAVLVDLHAEVTSEKVAFGHYVDGRVSALLGTHTHIPTADGQILPQGTAYITDVGMVGAKESVIGVQKEIIIQNFLTQIGKSHEIPKQGICTVNAVLVEIDPETKRAIDIKRIDREVEIR